MMVLNPRFKCDKCGAYRRYFEHGKVTMNRNSGYDAKNICKQCPR